MYIVAIIIGYLLGMPSPAFRDQEAKPENKWQRQSGGNESIHTAAKCEGKPYCILAVPVL